MRRAGSFVTAFAVALLFVPSPAGAKGDFFEFRLSGPTSTSQIAFRLKPMSWGDPASALPADAWPRYAMRVSLGFNSSPKLIPMPWSLVYFPAGQRRGARILIPEGPEEQRWYAPDRELQGAFDAHLAGLYPASEGGSVSAPASAGPHLVWLGAILPPMGAACLLARRGRLRGGRRPGRAGRA